MKYKRLPSYNIEDGALDSWECITDIGNFIIIKYSNGEYSCKAYIKGQMFYLGLTNLWREAKHICRKYYAKFSKDCYEE